MTWQILFTQKAKKQIRKLAKETQLKIKKAILNKLTKHPDIYLQPLVGPLSKYHKFRVGEYRLICHQKNQTLVIIVIEIGHRKEVYK